MMITRPIEKITRLPAVVWMLVATWTVVVLACAVGPGVEAAAAADTPTLQGFTPDVSVGRGQTVHFKIETDATAYTITIYRLDSGGVAGSQPAGFVPNPPAPQVQPPCLTDPDIGIDCSNWSESASWAVPADAAPGIYIALLERPDTSTSTSIVFVIQSEAGN